MLLAPNWAASEAHAGRQLPSYGYAQNEPVTNLDVDGLKVNASFSVGPDVFGPTPCQMPGGGTYPGCTETSFPSARVSARCEKDTSAQCDPGGRWRFDAWITVRVTRHFESRAAMSSPSGDSPGLSLAQHENLHVADYRYAYSENEINRSVRTEGFSSRTECEAARQAFARTFQSYADAVTSFSCIAHDQHICR